jgi:GR25 family glycosyltransferase involved in LPS biosynthesis
MRVETLLIVLVLILIICMVMALALLFFSSRPGALYTPAPILAPNFECFVINMAKNRERMINFDAQYSRSDLAARPYTRIEAVNGAAMGDKMREYVTPKVWMGMNYLNQMKVRMGDGQLTPGMIGCYLSHYVIFKQVVEDKLPYAVIFEDDASIHPRIYSKKIQSIVEPDGTFPRDWDVILLGHWCKSCAPVTPDYSDVKYFWGTHGYMVSQQGAQKLINLRKNEISMQIDGFMSYLSQQGQLKVLAIHPSYVVQANFGSDIQMQVATMGKI